jgi:hypothetical protein
MADGVGLLASAVMVLAILNLTPGLRVSPLWQMFAVLIFGTLNLVAWKQMTVTPISLHQAAKWVLICAAILLGLALVDTLIGVIIEHRSTIPDAFIHSGPVGGVLDALLFLCGSIFGVPTLAYAVSLYYRDRHHT